LHYQRDPFWIPSTGAFPPTYGKLTIALPRTIAAAKLPAGQRTHRRGNRICPLPGGCPLITQNERTIASENGCRTRVVELKLDEYARIMKLKQANTTRLQEAAKSLIGLTVTYFDKGEADGQYFIEIIL